MNLWSRFQALTTNNSNMILVGTCVSAVFGSCVIRWPGGATVTAQGAGTVGNKYFLYQRVDGSWRLDGEAPDLPLITIDI